MEKIICLFGVSSRARRYYNSITKIIVFLGMILPGMASSQKIITGKVFDAVNKKPLVWASITAKGSTTGLLTHDDGTFTMKITKKVNAFVISYVGYKSRTIRVEDVTTDYFIALRPLLNEPSITVTGKIPPIPACAGYTYIDDKQFKK